MEDGRPFADLAFFAGVGRDGCRLADDFRKNLTKQFVVKRIGYICPGGAPLGFAANREIAQ